MRCHFTGVTEQWWNIKAWYPCKYSQKRGAMQHNIM